MRLSLVIAAHNEGNCLAKTVQSCVETCGGLDYEIVIADDASWDGSIEETQLRYPQVRVVRHDERKGASPTKDLGARAARGEVLVFLDGHTRPEPGAVERLVDDVEAFGGNAVFTPAVAGLCTKRWKILAQQVGHGYFLDLEQFHCGWLPLADLKKLPHRGKTFYESPALIGCALAVHRELYDDLRGFDPHMTSWGVEDLDFGLKCWLMGFPILHDPAAVIGHRFRKEFDNFTVPPEHLLRNQIRMARKNFTPAVWSEWLERCRARHSGGLPDHPEGLWAYAWELFEQTRASAEAERSYLFSRRPRDEFWYAERFSLEWPRLGGGPVESSRLMLLGEGSPSPEPSPSPPPPCGCRILRDEKEITDSNRTVLPGEQINLQLKCDSGAVTEITWILPGKPFKSYSASNTNASLTKLAMTDRDDLSITFYWADTGNNRVVKVQFKLNGTPCEEQVILNVIEPLVEFEEGYNPPPIGTTRFIPSSTSPTVILDGANATNAPGIAFKANVRVPDGFLEGVWHYVQTVMPDRTHKTILLEECESNRALTTVLDVTYPHQPPPEDPLPGSPGSYPTDGVFREISDTPFTVFEENHSQSVGDETWRMYIMFKPDGNSSEWVPLRVVQWGWNYCAINVAGLWLLEEKGQSTTPWSLTSDHPVWDGNVALLPDHEVECPPPCEES